jgi:membrane peptidoglycan carboxypeptidase
MFKRSTTPPPAQIPQLVVITSAGEETRHDLVDLGAEKYYVGRDPADSPIEQGKIIIPDRSVSETHFTLRPDKMRGRGFIIFDEGSTNGLYRGQRKIKQARLWHGNKFTLGKPDLAGVVSIAYHHPPNSQQKMLSYGVYGVSGLLGLGLLGFLWETGKVDIAKLPAAEGPIAIYTQADPQTPLHTIRGVTYGKVSDVSSRIRDALIAKEDRGFYGHIGINILSSARAFVTNYGGASTLNMQLVATLYPKYMYTGLADRQPLKKEELEEKIQEYKSGIKKDRTKVNRLDIIAAKVRQMLLATRLDATHSKDALLLAYMNRVFLAGYHGGGFEGAAQRYFGRSASDLNLAQSALLVGMLTSPSNSNPCVTRESASKTQEPFNARVQQIIVLQKMLKAGVISDGEIKQITGWNESIKDFQEDPRGKDPIANTLQKMVNAGTITKAESAQILAGAALTAPQLGGLQKIQKTGAVKESEAETLIQWNEGIQKLKADPNNKKQIARPKRTTDITDRVEREQNLHEKLQIKKTACNAATGSLSRQKIYNQIADEFKELQETRGKDLADLGSIAIETSLDLKMQEKAESLLEKAIASNGQRKGFQQGALVTIDSKTGAVKAMVGGVPPTEYNLATDIFAQSGSTFKLFTYAAALSKGIPATKTYSCAPINWEGYGEKLGGCKHATGNIDMYAGFALSENVTALSIAREVGIEQVQTMARTMGLTSKIEDRPAIVLGTSQTSVLEMTGAYSTIAARGTWRKPHLIQRIYDTSNCAPQSKDLGCRRVVYDASKDAAAVAVLKPEVADTITDLMQGVVTRPNATGKSAAIPGLKVAGKTGTTDRNGNLWFIGFAAGQPEVTGVWLGNEGNRNNRPTAGSSADAAQLWSSYMGAILSAPKK